ncbi:hypothetical protein FRC12_012754 [Ceratobasidium sp. 428]|nr:hypothetical protein FRC12_012754 [Ceratobasidium sp. 428]
MQREPLGVISTNVCENNFFYYVFSPILVALVAGFEEYRRYHAAQGAVIRLTPHTSGPRRLNLVAASPSTDVREWFNLSMRGVLEGLRRHRTMHSALHRLSSSHVPEQQNVVVCTGTLFYIAYNLLSFYIRYTHLWSMNPAINTPVIE